MSEKSQTLIQTLEEISLNAWPPLQQMLYDGWILRFANGYTKRANSVNSVYPGTKNVYEKIERCERIYIENQLTPIFRITPLTHPQNLDEILANAGYIKKDISSIQVLDLELFQPQITDNVRLWTDFSQEWLDNFVQFSRVPVESQDTLADILRNIASKKCFVSILYDDKPLSCGLGVLENQYIGLFEIVTAKSERNKGFGKALILNILSWAKQNGAKKAYLQVVMHNEAALNIYSKLGFREVYQYFYRIKETIKNN